MKLTKEECQQAIRNLETINLDVVLDELGYEKANKISVYGISDYPNLEKSGDIEVLQNLVDEHFDNSPLKFEELEIIKPYWDNEERVWCYFVTLHNEFKTGVKITISNIPLIGAFKFEKNRFFRKQVEE